MWDVPDLFKPRAHTQYIARYLKKFCGINISMKFFFNKIKQFSAF